MQGLEEMKVPLTSSAQKGEEILTIEVSKTQTDKQKEVQSDMSHYEEASMQAKFVLPMPTEIKIRLNLWDTVGTERYAAMNRQYFSDAVCAIIVYDITDADSLADATKWLALTEQHCPKKMLKILCGNKLDLYMDRVVSTQMAKSFADDYEFDYFFEVSARESTGILNMVNEIGQAISDRASQIVS